MVKLAFCIHSVWASAGDARGMNVVAVSTKGHGGFLLRAVIAVWPVYDCAGA